MDANALEAATTTLGKVADSVSGFQISVYGTDDYQEYTDGGKLFLWEQSSHRPLQEMIYSKAKTDARNTKAQTALVDVKTYVQRFKERPPGCVNYGNVFMKMGDEHRPLNVIVASGKPCSNLKLKLLSGSSLKIVVLLMLEQDLRTPGYEVFAARERVFKKIMPGAVVLKPYETEKLRTLLSGGQIDTAESQVVLAGGAAAVPIPSKKTTRTTESNCEGQGDSQSQSMPEMHLAILSPNAGAWVGWEAQVEGMGACSRSVWLVMHPVGDATYYVQQRAEVRAHGSFIGTVILGHGGDDVDCGAVFEIRAFESPKDNLFLGKRLSFWPDADAASISIPIRRSCGSNGL